MNEAVFPLVGALFWFGVALPACALAAKLIFRLIRTVSGGDHLHAHGTLQYALLVLPTALPIAWMVSSGIHQAESGAASAVCLVEHGARSLCHEPLLFVLILLLLVGMRALPVLLKRERVAKVEEDDRIVTVRNRIEALLEGTSMEYLVTRMTVVPAARAPLASRGILSQRLVIVADFACRLDDEALVAALAHEAEHLRTHDSLRYALAWIALTVNPFGWALLGSELKRWIVAREAHCDREAVLRGASPTSLAAALVHAARYSVPGTPCSALGATEHDVLTLRVALLMSYVERLPLQCCRGPALRFALAALLLAFLLPHGTGTDTLDFLHVSAEAAASLLLEN